MIHLTLQSRGAPEGTFYGATKNPLRDLDEIAQENAVRLH